MRGLVVFFIALSVQAHFQVLLPDRVIIEAAQARQVALYLAFTHPMAQGPLMQMGQPRSFGVLVEGERTDLLASLVARQQDGVTWYTADYAIRKPGDHVFYVEPAPYWEPAEQKMIIHYTKVVVDAYDGGSGWDAMVGFPIEIEPLVRPYGLWAGNLFRGIVRRNGEPVPFAEIEVEYYNEGGRVKLPSAPFETQVIKADAQGVFAYAMPRAGWWGFAALVDGETPMTNPDGEEVDVELGGLIWIHTTEMQTAED